MRGWLYNFLTYFDSAVITVWKVCTVHWPSTGNPVSGNQSETMVEQAGKKTEVSLGA
jgi:hypothetical protein